MWLWYINKIGAFVKFKITAKKGNLFSMTNASEDIYIFWLCNSIKLANRFFFMIYWIFKFVSDWQLVAINRKKSTNLIAGK